MKEFLFFWGSTILLNLFMRSTIAMKMFKDVCSTGCYIKSKRLSEFSDNITTPEQRKSLKMLNYVPFFNVLYAMKLSADYNNQAGAIMDQLYAVDAIGRMDDDLQKKYEEKPTFINALKCTIESSQRDELRDLIEETKTNVAEVKIVQEEIGAENVFIFTKGTIYAKKVDGKLQIIRKDGEVSIEDICRSISHLDELNKKNGDNPQTKSRMDELTQILDCMIEEENPKLKAIREKKEALQQEYDNLKAQIDKEGIKLTRRRK